MLKRLIFGVFVAIICIIPAILTSTAYQGDRVLISPQQNLKQGQTVFIKLITEKNLVSPYVEFNGGKFKLFKAGKGCYNAMMGIDALTKPGIYALKIVDNKNPAFYKSTVCIKSAHFPIQNIVVSKATKELQPAPGELETVQKAKMTLSDYAYWNTKLPPYVSPTKGCIISVYGLNRYYNGKPSGNYHKGIDIKAPKGQEIDSIAPGKVLIARMFRLNGGTVAVDHGQGLVSFYLHMSKIVAKEGQTVKAGEKIGEIGSTGFATGPHLHWGLYVHGTPINPMDFWIKPTSKCL